MWNAVITLLKLYLGPLKIILFYLFLQTTSSQGDLKRKKGTQFNSPAVLLLLMYEMHCATNHQNNFRIPESSACSR